jgi:hypothetical protein
MKTAEPLADGYEALSSLFFMDAPSRPGSHPSVPPPTDVYAIPREYLVEAILAKDAVFSAC